MSERTYMGGAPEDPRGRRQDDNGDDSFRFTYPKWIKNVGVGVGKWGPQWIMVFAVLYGGWLLTNRVMARAEEREERAEIREDKLIKALDTLSTVQETLGSHMRTSEKTQLFISTMCAGLANQADTSAQRRELERACYNEYYAQELKEKKLSR